MFSTCNNLRTNNKSNFLHFFLTVKLETCWLLKDKEGLKTKTKVSQFYFILFTRHQLD